SLAIFVIIALGVLGSYAALSRSVKVARERTILASLASNYMEIVKNMPYSQVGTKIGNPNGPLADFTNPIITKIESYTYRIYYEVTYIDDPADNSAPTDLEPADYKQIKMHVTNTTTGQLTSFTTNMVPKGLEGTLNAGALRINVINSSGQPIFGASIHIESTTTAPNIILDRTSDSAGQWVEVGLPAKVNGYRIVVTKAGYSTDQTYPITAQNPSPIKPDATIVDGQVTQITFSIDLLSTLNIRTLNGLCQNLNGVNMNVKGAKLIGITPDVLKFNNNYSSAGGLIALSNLEWDTYTPTLLTGQSWVVLGTSPIQKIDVLPGTTQTFTAILGTNTTANSLLVIVKDSSTGSAVEWANVHLHKGGSVPQDYYGITGGSVWVQQDWTAGGGQVNWSTSSPDRYFQDDANIDINSVPTGVRLNKITGRYVASGWFESSTFDTGTSATNFTTLNWQPLSQSASTTLLLQVAANNDNSTWNYIGPDGTSSTYFSVPGSSIPSSLDGSQYVRYKAFLQTLDDKKTPVLTSVEVNYVSGCYTPGQIWFGDLTAGNNYDLEVSLPGYQTVNLNNLNVSGNQTLEVLMSP
ncbi:MAG: carboxypeptidase regulatory-like domain-containing protein, partial [Candidatus Doudnabacteria bacterium]|nr:carboxypeptidase regulatory-like domain-containing protein [Candidatus Doudnabacteria bacterium]